ncbi:hypothetical protein GCM10028806_57880 [Spirosoma terrae]|uniref:4Fe-4S dicluster domain-containing protein n=1 Tax=Spirosoma terrae TaxID=1968276 RepID=A0A6L9LC36_9BACT|nr:4Fe-4S dicluster domain-containing protein [Spirosoma terrae]NDU98010.1 4Fe-4S dicluster domain-containing protein [Spirosoma terrae]
MSYFKDIRAGIRTTLKGLSITLRHLKNATHRRTPQGIADATYFDQQNGLVTLQYPHEQLPIPDNGRYRLRNEIDDCIVCDKCAKVCPVDCITIDAIKATEEVGRASDGSPIRLYAATFDIDMAKCCYCGLCTVVCPTECLTMDKKFDYSEFELGELTYQFSNLTPEQADEKRSAYEQFLREKEEQKAAQIAAKADAQSTAQPTTPAGKPKPVFRPGAKPSLPVNKPASSESSVEHPLTDATPDEMQQIAQGGLEAKKHPVFRPTKKPSTIVPDAPVSHQENSPEKEPTPDSDVASLETETSTSAPKIPAAFRPTMKPKTAEPESATALEEIQKQGIRDEVIKTDEAPGKLAAPNPKPGFRPTMKPKAAQPSDTESNKPTADVVAETKKGDVAEASKPKGAFRPTMKPKVDSAANKPEPEQESKESVTPVEKATDPVVEPVKPKPAFRPTMKPKNETVIPDEQKEIPNSSAQSQETQVGGAPKPVFRPTMKPKPAPPKSETDE